MLSLKQFYPIEFLKLGLVWEVSSKRIKQFLQDETSPKHEINVLFD